MRTDENILSVIRHPYIKYSSPSALINMTSTKTNKQKTPAIKVREKNMQGEQRKKIMKRE